MNQAKKKGIQVRYNDDGQDKMWGVLPLLPLFMTDAVNGNNEKLACYFPVRVYIAIHLYYGRWLISRLILATDKVIHKRRSIKVRNRRGREGRLAYWNNIMGFDC